MVQVDRFFLQSPHTFLHIRIKIRLLFVISSLAKRVMHSIWLQVSVCINENEIVNWVLIQTKKKFAFISTPVNGWFVAIFQINVCKKPSYYIFAAFLNLFELEQNFYQHETVKLLTNCVAIAKQWEEHNSFLSPCVFDSMCVCTEKTR